MAFGVPVKLGLTCGALGVADAPEVTDERPRHGSSTIGLFLGH